MLRDIIPILVALIIALVGGIYSAAIVTKDFEGFQPLEYGAWTAWPSAGTVEADPYSRAHAARAGRIPLGSAEGLMFAAKQDDAGRLLDSRCNYVIDGKSPAARFWTIRITDEQLDPIGNLSDGIFELSSTSVLRNGDETFSIHVSKNMRPGNWLQNIGTGNRVLLFTLYDTSIASTTGVSAVTTPQIKNVGCIDG